MKRTLMLVLGLVLAFGLFLGCPTPEEEPPPGEERKGPPGNPEGFYDHVTETIMPGDLADYETDYDNDGTAELEAFNTDPFLALTQMLFLRFATDIPIGRAMLSDPDLSWLPDQVSFELHNRALFGGPSVDFRDVVLLSRMLFAAGYRSVSRENNPDHAPCCVEFTLVRIRC